MEQGFPIFRNYLEDEDDKPYFTVNSLAYYYEDMERKQKLITDMSKLLLGYDNKLNVNLEEMEKRIAAELGKWDGKVEELPETVNDLLTQWVEDGSLTALIDTTLLDKKADVSQVNTLTTQLAETENKIVDTGQHITGVVVKSKVKPNVFNERTINTLGASNVHGAGTTDMGNQGFAALIRKYFQKTLNMKNHGFVNALDAIGTNGVWQDFHKITGTWTKSNSASVIGNAQMFTNTTGAKMFVEVKTPVKGFRVYFGGKTKSSKIEVRINGMLKTTIDTLNPNAYARTPLIDVSDQSFPMVIEFEKMDNVETVGVYGLSYYDDETSVVYNNFARSGVTLTSMTDALLDFYSDSDIVFFGLGNNDAGNAIPIADFKARLDYLKVKMIERGTFLIVTDYIWDAFADNIYKQALKQFALNVNGLYLDLYKGVFNDVPESQLLAQGLLVDDSHLSVSGHKLVADYIIRQMEPRLNSLDSFKAKKAEVNDGVVEDTSWKYVGAAEAPFENTWVNSVTNATKYKKVNGVVFIDMYVKNTTFASSVFTLPVGYRPAVPFESIFSGGTDMQFSIKVTTAGLVAIKALRVVLSDGTTAINYTTNYGAVLSFVAK